MLTKIFKKNSEKKGKSHSDLSQLEQFGTRSAFCRIVRTADGREAHEEVGPVSFYCLKNQLFTRGSAIYLAPPQGYSSNAIQLSGQGEVVNFRFYHQRIPYSLDCQVVKRVRFSDRLIKKLDPGLRVGYKLMPLGNLKKNDGRRSLRFANIQKVKGPKVSPYFQFDVFVELVEFNGLAHEQPPTIIPFLCDDPVLEGIHDCDSQEDQVAFFYNTIKSNPEHLKEIHLAKVLYDFRSSATELLDLGPTSVLGMKRKSRGALIHLRNPKLNKRKDKNDSENLRAGDMIIIHFVGCNLLKTGNVHYRWPVRVSKCGLETLTLRSRDVIHIQTGMEIVLKDFSVTGVSFQNSPTLENYLLGEKEFRGDSEARLKLLEGKGLLLYFYPQLHFPKALASYCPQIPARFSVLGKVVRGHIDSEKDTERITNLGVEFCYDPVDYDAKTLNTTAWEPLRGLRENLHFKEIHRALNSLLAYLER